MNNTIDCTGMACPLPVVNAKKAFADFSEDGELTVLVDNPTAVENLKKTAEQLAGGEPTKKKERDI